LNLTCDACYAVFAHFNNFNVWIPVFRPQTTDASKYASFLDSGQQTGESDLT